MDSVGDEQSAGILSLLQLLLGFGKGKAKDSWQRELESVPRWSWEAGNAQGVFVRVPRSSPGVS